MPRWKHWTTEMKFESLLKTTKDNDFIFNITNAILFAPACEKNFYYENYKKPEYQKIINKIFKQIHKNRISKQLKIMRKMNIAGSDALLITLFKYIEGQEKRDMQKLGLDVEEQEKNEISFKLTIQEKENGEENRDKTYEIKNIKQ